MVIFYGHAERKLKCHAKSKHQTDSIPAITSTRIYEALLCLIGIQEKTDINKMHVSNLLKKTQKCF